MFDAEQTLNTDSAGQAEGQQDAEARTPSSSDTPSSDAPKQDELSLLERATGRKFSDLAQAEQYLRNLNSLVGDNAVANARKKAEFADAVVSQYATEKGLSYDEAEEELRTIVSPKTRRAVSTSDQPKVDPRTEALEREIFLMKTPEANPFIDKVSRYAKAENMSLSDAYKELYGDVIKTKAREEQLEAKREGKKLASISTSSSATAAPAIPRSKQLLEQYAKTGDASIYREAIKARSEETWNKKEE